MSDGMCRFMPCFDIGIIYNCIYLVSYRLSQVLACGSLFLVFLNDFATWPAGHRYALNIPEISSFQGIIVGVQTCHVFAKKNCDLRLA